MNKHLFVKNLRCFPTKLSIFLTNPNDSLKNSSHSKIILGHAVFQLLFESTFSLNLWLLFHLVKEREKYKQVIKFG